MNARALRKQQAGFTLIELVIVIAVIGILASIALMKFNNSSASAKQAVCDYNRNIGEKAYSAYLTTGGAYNPAGQTGAAFLVNAGLLASDLKGGTFTWVQDAGGSVRLNCVPNGGTTGTTLFSSTFANADGIKYLQGAWSVVGGSLVPTATSENKAAFAGTYGTNYDITANVDLTSGRGYGIYYHITAPNGSTAMPTNNLISGYVFQVDPGYSVPGDGGNKDYFLVRKLTNGSESNPVAYVAIPAGLSAYGSHTVAISVQGNSQVFSVDGVQVLTYTDTSSTPYAAGYVGARTWTAPQVLPDVKFLDVSVVAK